MSDTATPLLGPRVPAARNAIAALRVLASSTSALTAGEIAQALGTPRSSTYQLLQVLVDEGVVVHLPELRAYALGVGVFEFGSAYLRQQPLENLARPLLSRLARRAEVTAQLGILRGNEILYLLREDGPRRRTELVTAVGVRLPAHLTASGRSLLALLPDHRVEALFAPPGSFVDRTGLGPRTPAELLHLLRADRKRGHTVEAGAVTNGITCIAAAAVDRDGLPMASVTVSLPSADASDAALETLSHGVIQTARALSRRLDGRPPP
ncbi:IclR family transcriptional regulator [Kineococcus sp. GCM10028916]|uniref:IclR family transcriptional regulator n=1 Tax=Kineococcus sp. GCM10028916 TaxID=3273394 RepID=UPI00362C563E